MLTGRRPFEGDDVSLTLADVMRAQPDWECLPGRLSPAIHTYLRRCFEKNSRQRVQSIGDVRLALDGAFDAAAGDSAPGPETLAVEGFAWRRSLPWGASGLLLGGGIAALIFASVLRPEPTSDQVPSRFVMVAAEDGPVGTAGPNSDVAISPDGVHVVYMSGNTILGSELYIRSVGDLQAVLLRGTLGAANPFFSPDGEWVGFRDAFDNALKRVSVQGGPAVTMWVPPPTGARASIRTEKRRGDTMPVSDGLVFCILDLRDSPTPLSRGQNTREGAVVADSRPNRFQNSISRRRVVVKGPAVRWRHACLEGSRIGSAVKSASETVHYFPCVNTFAGRVFRVTTSGVLETATVGAHWHSAFPRWRRQALCTGVLHVGSLHSLGRHAVVRRERHALHLSHAA